MNDAAMIFMGLILFMLGCSFGTLISDITAQQKYKEMEEQIAEESNRAFSRGYELGKFSGYQRCVQEKVTPNMLREYLGLQPMDEVTDTTEEQQ